MKKLTLLITALILIPALVLATTIMISNKPIDTENYEFNKITGDTLLIKGAWQEAINYYEQALEIKPDDQKTQQNLAYAYTKTEEYTQATNILKKLLRKDSESPSYNYDYAINIMLELKKTGQAEIEELETALKHFKKSNELKPGYLKAKENIEFTQKLIDKYYQAE